VVLSHLYGAAPHLRRMYRCVPEGRQPEGLEAKSHRFAPPMPRVMGTGECTACEHSFGPHDGHQSGQDYSFTAREAAGALVALARGGSYRRSSFDARVGAGRVPGRARRNGSLVSGWLEVFVELLWDRAQPAVKPPMPEAIYVDVLVHRRRVTREDGSRRMAGPKRLFVYVAMAYLDADGPTPLLLWADTADDRAAWARFYQEVADLFAPGGAPRWVVSDGEHAARAAIPQVWPTAKLWRCHWHIQRIACDHLKRLTVPANDERFVNASKLMRSKDHWEQFAADAAALGDRKLNRWVATNRGLIEQQLRAVAARQRPRALAIGQCEGWEEQVKAAFRRRAGAFTNLPRLRQLFRLMTLDARGLAQQDRWAAVIRQELSARDGRPGHRPRWMAEPAGSPSIR
jgi:hypothetical protein